MKISSDIKNRVFQNLDNAMENGYNMVYSDPLVVADDMLMYADHDFENELIVHQDTPDLLASEVAKHVTEWQNVRKQK